MESDYQCRCGKSYASAEALKKHQRYHCRHDDPHATADGTGFGCPECGRVFSTRSGMSQHRRRAHPAEYNAELESRDVRKKATFSALETLHIINEELRVEGSVININLHLGAKFDRDADAVKNLRRTQAYKTQRDRVRGELEEAAEQEPAPEPPVRAPSPVAGPSSAVPMPPPAASPVGQRRVLRARARPAGRVAPPVALPAAVEAPLPQLSTQSVHTSSRCSRRRASWTETPDFSGQSPITQIFR